MAGQSAAQALLLRCLFFLMVLFVRAETEKPDLRCPDYVANYAPLVWLHSEDPYMPSDLLAHLQHTTPTVQGHAIDGIPSINLGNLGTLNEFGDEDVALVSKDDPFSYPKWILGEAPDDAGRIHNATPCAVILVEKNEVDLDAFYFYFYSYNEGPNITQVLEPLNRLVTSEKASAGMHFGNHVGDWEHNMVRFRDGKPIGIYYSQHVDGEGYDWNDGAVSKAGDRPIVYSARGSHANYAVPGAPVHNAALVDYCDEGKRWDPVLSAYFYKLDIDTFTLVPLAPPKQQSPRSSSNHTSWFEYKGHWGDFQFPQSDPRQETIPRFGVHRFETGPNGPRFKHLLRKGLVRDQARKMSWTEWAVGIYMYWYPCCIRGWRKWISVGVIITAFAAVAVGIILGVRRLRKPKTVYTKLQAEDIQMDEWRRDEEALLSSSEDEDDRHSK